MSKIQHKFQEYRGNYSQSGLDFHRHLFQVLLSYTSYENLLKVTKKRKVSKHKASQNISAVAEGSS